MKTFQITGFLLFLFFSLQAQPKSDSWLDSLIRANASPQLLHVLNNPDSFQYQLIYSVIDRDRKDEPLISKHSLNVGRYFYFNPASTVKLPVALLALEKLNELKVAELTKETPMLTDSSWERQTRVRIDSTAENGLPSVAHYIKKIFLVSDNDAYNRLYEFLGQEYMNEKLWAKGYPKTRITRRFVTMNEEQNRHTNSIQFINAGKIIYHQRESRSNIKFNFDRKILIGKAHFNREDSLINYPMDFTTHNNLPLKDLDQMLQSVIFPLTVPSEQRFRISNADRRFLLKYMSELPSESAYPKYDSSAYFDSYCKFFFFRAGKGKIPSHIRSFNKSGWSYGFLTDAAYIADFKNKVEFMLTAVIYVNSDGILNDDKYEYESVGWPFFKEIGNIIYQYELKRKRQYKPRLDQFVLDYN